MYEEEVSDVVMPTGDAFYQTLHYCFEAQLHGGKTGARGCSTVPFLLGAPSTAKTAKVQQYIKWVYEHGSEVLGIKHPRVKVNIFILAQADSVDIGGAIAPDFKNNKIKRLIPDDILGLADCDDYDLVINFIDESTNTTPSMISALASVIEDGQIYGRKKAKNCVFILAGNRPEDGTGSIKMPRQMMEGRLVTINMTVDTEEWLDWAVEEDLHVKCVAPIRWKNSLLYNYNPKAKGTNPTPRGWHKASNLLYRMPFEDTDAIDVLFPGCIGAGTYAEARGFWAHGENLPLYEEILADPLGCPVPVIGDESGAGPSGQYAIATNISYHIQEIRHNGGFLSRIDSGSLITYMNRLEDEIGMFAMRLCGDANPELKGCSEYSAFAEKNKDLLIRSS